MNRWFAAFQIFAAHGLDDFDVSAEHDVLYVHVPEILFHSPEGKRLRDLGWHKDEDAGDDDDQINEEESCITMSELLPVTVKRSQWYRGYGGWESKLLRSQDGLMCCLGFACLAAGHELADIADKGYLYDMGDLAPALQRLVTQAEYPNNSLVGRKIAETNDACDMTDADREAKLTVLGRDAGIAFTFED